MPDDLGLIERAAIAAHTTDIPALVDRLRAERRYDECEISPQIDEAFESYEALCDAAAAALTAQAAEIERLAAERDAAWCEGAEAMRVEAMEWHKAQAVRLRARAMVMPARKHKENIRMEARTHRNAREGVADLPMPERKP